MLQIGKIVIMKESEYRGITHDKKMYYDLYHKKSNELSNLKITKNVEAINA